MDTYGIYLTVSSFSVFKSQEPEPAHKYLPLFHSQVLDASPL